MSIKKYVIALAAVAIAGLGAESALAQQAVGPAFVYPFVGGGGSVASGSAVSGCTINSLVYIDGSGNLACALTPVNGSVSTAGRSILTIRDTITGASATSNFLNVTGTMPATLSADTNAIYVGITTDNDAQDQNAIYATVASANTSLTKKEAAVKGIITGTGNGAAGYFQQSSNNAQNNYALVGLSDGPGGSAGMAVFGLSTTSTFQTVGVLGAATGSRSYGVMGTANSAAATASIGGYFELGASYGFSSSPPTPAGSAALVANNGSAAANIFEARDNGTATSTTAASANVTILDGAQMRLGNQVLTGSTMTPTIVGEVRTVTHSYAWTNAMVTALGASLTGDINVAVLPAKTQVESALVIIDSPDSSANALTVSCGDTGAGATNYVVAGDAKAAANTIYGDLISGAETGAALFDATSKWRRNYIPSYTATTTVSCRFTKSVTNLSTVTGSTGRVILTTTLIP